MNKFKVKAYTVEFYEDEVEAENEEEAKEKFMEKWENAEISNDETQFFFDDEDGFDILNNIFLDENSQD